MDVCLCESGNHGNRLRNGRRSVPRFRSSSQAIISTELNVFKIEGSQRKPPDFFSGIQRFSVLDVETVLASRALDLEMGSGV